MTLSKKHRTKRKSYKKDTKKRLHRYKSRTAKRMRLRKQKGGGIGNVLRTQLVDLCKEGNWEEYERVTRRIIDDYRHGKKDFFIYLDKEMFLRSDQDTHNKNPRGFRRDTRNKKPRGFRSDTDDDNEPRGFKIDTILCLERCLTRLQEEAIPESMVHLTTAVNARKSINH
jgi:hypothetical protein